MVSTAGKSPGETPPEPGSIPGSSTTQPNGGEMERERRKLAITLDKSDPMPVKPVKRRCPEPSVDNSIVYPINTIFKKYFQPRREEQCNGTN